jgi:hypothetical protein
MSFPFIRNDAYFSLLRSFQVLVDLFGVVEAAPFQVDAVVDFLHSCTANQTLSQRLVFFEALTTELIALAAITEQMKLSIGRQFVSGSRTEAPAARTPHPPPLENQQAQRLMNARLAGAQGDVPFNGQGNLPARRTSSFPAVGALPRPARSDYSTVTGLTKPLKEGWTCVPITVLIPKALRP